MSRSKHNGCPRGRNCGVCHLSSQMGNGADKLPACDKRKLQEDAVGFPCDCKTEDWCYHCSPDDDGDGYWASIWDEYLETLTAMLWAAYLEEDDE